MADRSLFQVPGGMDALGQQRMPYAPERDLVNQLPQMMKSIARFHNFRGWPQLVKMVADLQEISEEAANDQMVDAHDVFKEFLTQCCANCNENYNDVMRRVGWEKLSQPTRFGYLALLGAVIAGQLFTFIRDVSLNGEVPPNHIKPLLAFYVEQSRQLENGLTEEAYIAEFKRAVQNCRTARISYASMEDILLGLKTGSITPEADRA